ncbi:MAG: helix-turn-helix transcriptional regulator [Clostridiales bacterium]|nr:helix-turn-helix transcriptional regulator [Clostridiales bacterium]
MDTKEFGSFIAQQRKEAGLTQKELAERLNVTDKAVSRWENGHGYPDIETLESLSRELNVSLLELMHSKKNETDSVTVEEASQTISDTIQMNIGDRRRERKITAVILGVSLIGIIGLSLFRGAPLAWIITAVFGALYLIGTVMMLIDYKRYRTMRNLFFAILMSLVFFAVIFLLLATNIKIA